MLSFFALFERLIVVFSVRFMAGEVGNIIANLLLCSMQSLFEELEISPQG